MTDRALHARPASPVPETRRSPLHRRRCDERTGTSGLVGVVILVLGWVWPTDHVASKAETASRGTIAVSEDPVVVDAAADTFVIFDTGTGVPVSTKPHGADHSLNIGFWDTGEDMDGLVRFGPPPVALADRRLDRAELWLTVASAESISHDRDGSRKAAPLSFKPALDAWDEPTVIGANRPRSGETEAIGVATVGLLKVDFSAPARSWLAGDRPHGWTVRAGSSAVGGSIGVSVWITSREAGDGPRLVLYWETDDETPTPAASPSPLLNETPAAMPTATSPSPLTVSYGNGLRLQGHTGGHPRDIGLANGYAVLALDGDLVVYDVRRPEAPSEIARLPLGLAIYRLFVRGDRAYAAGDGAVWVVDLANPRHPEVLGTAPLGAKAIDMGFTDDRLFIVEDAPTMALRVIDVADPAWPRDLGATVETFLDVDADAGLLVAARLFNGQANTSFDVFRAADLPGGSPIGRMEDSVLGQVAQVALAGRIAYVGVKRMTVIDLAEPSRPHRLTDFVVPWYATTLRADGTRVLTASPWNVGVIDVADPRQPRASKRGSIGLDPWPARSTKASMWVGVAAEDDTVVHVSDDTGLAVVSARNAEPERRGHVDVPRQSAPVDLAVAGEDVFVADANDAVLRVDASVPSAPVIVDRLESTMGQGMAVEVAADRVFALFHNSIAPGGSTLAELDTEVPGLPVRASIPIASLGVTPQSLDVVGDIAYVAAFDLGLIVIDVGRGAPFRERGRFIGGAHAVGVSVVGRVAYVVDYERGLEVIDVADPAAPRLLSLLALPGQASRITVAGSHVFAEWYGNTGRLSLSVVDVSDPTSPILLPPIYVPAGTLTVDATNGCLFVSGAGALRVFDISRPSEPRLLDALPRFAFLSMESVSTRLFATSTELGLVTLRYDCAARHRAGRPAYLPLGYR